MSNRRKKWKGVRLNHVNIDEYMNDLIDDTSGQYITQGVSFNKEDNFQMNLLKNAIVSNGSFSGFIKHLLHAHFEKHGRLDDSIFEPNSPVETQQEEETPPPPLPPVIESKEDGSQGGELEIAPKETTQKATPKPIKQTKPKPRGRNKSNPISQFTQFNED